MYIKYVILPAALLLGLGGCLGSKMADPKIERFTVHDTRVIHEPGKTVTVTKMPESCREALNFAARMDRAASKLYASGGRQLEIISNGRAALVESGDLSAIENQQRDLQANTVQHLFDLSDATYKYQQAAQQCEKDMK